MAFTLAPTDLVPIGEPAVSSMWEIAALMEILERKKGRNSVKNLFFPSSPAPS